MKTVNVRISQHEATVERGYKTATLRNDTE
jgi:hypothetical protein